MLIIANLEGYWSYNVDLSRGVARRGSAGARAPPSENFEIRAERGFQKISNFWQCQLN